ncbi:MAG: methylated-DNA--[protein]-cysteine S-methyltransferase [Ktedonobacterales bacterium]
MSAVETMIVAKARKTREALHATEQQRAVDEGCAVGMLTTWAGVARVAAAPTGVRYVWLPDWRTRIDPLAPPRLDTATVARATQTATAHITIEHLASTAAEEQLHNALTQLAGYFAGQRQAFTVALDPPGTNYFQRVWAAVAQVPYGETRAYQEVARQVGTPQGPRAVGMANGANPVAPFVPCHRLIGATGALTGYGSGLPLKRALLLLEDALPAGHDEYSAWVARVTQRLALQDGEQLLIGVRPLGVYCAPACQRSARYRLRPNRIFRSPDVAQSAGFAPCPICQA